MAVTPTHLTTNSSTTNATSYTTASITPTSGRLVLVGVLLSGTSPIPQPTVSGCGLTWTLVDQTPAAARTAYVFRAMGTPTAGALTITSSGVAYTSALWSVVEFAGADATGTGGSGAIVQSFNSRPASTSSVAESFPAAPVAGSGAFAVVGTAVQVSPTAGAGWSGSATNQSAPTSGLVGLYASSAPSAVNASWTTASNAFVVGVEVKAAAGGGGDVTAPTVPAGLTASAGGPTSVSLSWTASTDAVGVASYRIRRGGVDLAGATAVAGTSFTDSTVSASTAYSYTVSAVDAAGNRSAESTAAAVTTPAAPAPPGAPAPTAGVDARLYEVPRGPHTSYGYIEAWRNGSVVTFDGDTRLPMVDGSVEVDGSTPGVRRTLSASFAPIPGLFDALAPTGTELRAFSVIRPPNGVTQVDAQGVFDIDTQRMGYASNGDIRITAPDRWARVQRARFLVPRASLGGATVRAQIAALLNEAMPSGVTTVDLGTSTATMPAQVWDRDRDKAIEELAKAASLDVFMDRTGAPTIRDSPSIDAENVAWTVDAGALGVMVSAERERNRQRTYNVVVVNGTPNEGVAPFPTQFVWDSDPNSPTYAGPDPVNHPELAGPFGVRPTFYSSPLLRDVGQAQQAGHTILERVMGLESQLTLTTVPKRDLDDGATILVKLPPEYPRGPIPLELHVVDRMTVPLRPSKNNPMAISTRSTLAGYEGAE